MSYGYFSLSEKTKKDVHDAIINRLPKTNPSDSFHITIFSWSESKEWKIPPSEEYKKPLIWKTGEFDILETPDQNILMLNIEGGYAKRQELKDKHNFEHDYEAQGYKMHLSVMYDYKGIAPANIEPVPVEVIGEVYEAFQKDWRP